MAQHGKSNVKRARRKRKEMDVTQIRQESAYLTIQELKNQFLFKDLCEVLEISRSSYYKWLKRTPTHSEKRLIKLMDCIREAYEEHQGIYGYRRITIYLNH